MSTTETTNLALAKPDVGTEENAWGEKLNTIFDQLDDLVGGVLSKSVAGASDVTLSTSEAAHHTIYATGTLTGNISLIVPAKQRNYRIYNNTSGAFTLTVKTSGGSGVAVAQGDKGIISCDGTDCVDMISGKLSTAGGTMTGALNEAQGTDIASAGSIDLGAATGNFIEITGTATITALGTVAAGARREVRFAGTPTLKHNGTSLLLPGEADLAAEEDESATLISLGSGNWYCARYGRGSFPSGTKMLFQQTAAPTGWTKDTTHDNKALRVVSGTASSGGNTAFSSVFGASKTTGAHTLTIAEMPLHGHPYVDADTDSGNGAGAAFPRRSVAGNARVAYTGTPSGTTEGRTIGGSGGGGSHTHTLSLDLEYVDLIIASKD